jgi:Peptidase A4 family
MWQTCLASLVFITFSTAATGAPTVIREKRVTNPVSLSSPMFAPGTVGDRSPIWAGYVIVGHKGAFTDIRATWTQPSISCKSSLSSQNDDAFWIGLDGVTRASSTVEQVGTRGICRKSTVSYDAWYEVYPRLAVVAFTVQPKDTMVAEVESLGGTQFRITIRDESSGRSVQKTLTSAAADRSSAEWITETSASCDSCLEDFGKLDYSGAETSVGGTDRGIGAFSYHRVTMASKGQVMANVSALRDKGTSFTVNWESP